MISKSVHEGKPVSETVMRELCFRVVEILAEESNVVELRAPVNVVGDVHGQFFDVCKLLSIGTF